MWESVTCRRTHRYLAAKRARYLPSESDSELSAIAKKKSRGERGSEKKGKKKKGKKFAGTKRQPSLLYTSSRNRAISTLKCWKIRYVFSSMNVDSTFPQREFNRCPRFLYSARRCNFISPDPVGFLCF
ncbi:hypothetical protein PUN28_016526 [Cardiocondyla obscurior]|uniref:Uncharacterized protein n=1 Tax=Cardiocondyla obscurior TaxID=286306 RepID=A0AAW2EQ60_9HYME